MRRPPQLLHTFSAARLILRRSASCLMHGKFSSTTRACGSTKGFCFSFPCCAAGCIASYAIFHELREPCQRRARGRPAGSQCDRKQGYGHARILPFPPRLQYARKSEVPVISRAGSGDILVRRPGSISRRSGKASGGTYRRPAGLCMLNAAQMERRGHWPDVDLNESPLWEKDCRDSCTAIRAKSSRSISPNASRKSGGWSAIRRPCCGQGAAENARVDIMTDSWSRTRNSTSRFGS